MTVPGGEYGVLIAALGRWLREAEGQEWNTRCPQVQTGLRRGMSIVMTIAIPDETARRVEAVAAALATRLSM